ncbi:MAG TPA: Hsp20/alpha crystallin family protein [Gemmatimonadaceae bacterium]|nr:Hsp20/alpha crystallin family protein [Gemmatimonadaceae bacterium]
MLYTMTTTAPVFGLRREIDRLFESTFVRGQTAGNEWTPAVEIRETEQELSFVVELPGMTLDNLHVSAVNGILTIRGERVDEWKDGETHRYYLAERNYGSFMRRFELPQGVDVDKIGANIQNGILLVTIPKAALPQPQKIKVTAGTPVNGTTQRAKVGDGKSSADSGNVLVSAR